MKNIELSIKERLVGLGIFNNSENKVPTSELKAYIEDAAKFSISTEERETIGWEDVKNADGVTTGLKFDESKLPLKSMELSDFTIKYILEKLEATEYSANDQLALAIVSLIDKLKE